MTKCHSTTLLIVALPNLDSLTVLPYCSIQNVKTTFRDSTQVILTSTIPHLIDYLHRTFQVIKTFSIQRFSLIMIILVIIRTWLWRIFYSIWQTCYFCYLIWHLHPDMARCFYIPDCVLGSLFLPHGRGISYVNMSFSSGISPSLCSMRGNYFISCTR